jgi:peptidoglycan/LPS O-acetylase OafA/YrhL
MLALTYFLLILLVLIAPTKLMKQAFSAGWLRRLGVISYCAYLIHEPVRRTLFLLLRLGKNPVITNLKTLMVTVAALFVTLAIAQVSWLLLEKPLIRRAHLRHQYTN